LSPEHVARLLIKVAAMLPFLVCHCFAARSGTRG
jgi:hypothetical protein